MIFRRSARLGVLTALPTALVLGVSLPAATAVAAPAVPAKDGEQAYQIDLEQLNDSGASGIAFVTLEGRRLTVKIEAEGLVPDAPHAQHIHGSTDGHDFHCPTPDADEDGDGIVTTAEGLPSYGDITISLTTEGDTSKDSGLAVDRMPVADSEGRLSYDRTIEVSQKVADHFKDLHVVQHGIDVNGNGEYDAEAGRSELDPKLPQEATAPAACGMVRGAAIGSVPVGGVETGGAPAQAGGDPAAMVIGAGGVAFAAAAGMLLVNRRRAGLARGRLTRAED